MNLKHIHVATLLLCLCVALAAPVCAQSQDETAALIDLNSASISLNGDGITVDGFGVSVDGNIATITQPGSYTISGTLQNGQIIVDCDYDEKIILWLDNASIHCEDSAPIYIARSEKRTTIRMVANTVNVLSRGDGAADEEVDGVIYSKGDLTITDAGRLVIVAGEKAENIDGIVSKDDLRVKGGIIDITTNDDGIRGKDEIDISDGDITINVAGDALKSTNDKDPNRGFIAISGGKLTITCGDDVFNAKQAIRITGGTINATIVD